MELWAFPLIFLGGFLSWQFYRQFKKSGKVSKLILAQVSTFAAVYLVLDQVERRGLVTGRAMDYVTMGVVAVFVIVGSALTAAAVRKAAEKKKRATAVKKPVKLQPSKNKTKTVSAAKGTSKSKKRKG